MPTRRKSSSTPNFLSDFRATLGVALGTVLGVALILLAPAAPVFAQELPIIRMVVADGVADCSVGIAGPFSVQGDKSEIFLKGSHLSVSHVTCADGKIQLGACEIQQEKIILQAQHGDIRVSGNSFGPCMEISSCPGYRGNRLTLISLLDLEEYTGGVMEKEMEPTWPLEVLKAQAILARTNAVYAYQKKKGKPFHLTLRSPQFYARSERPDSQASVALEETRGLVLTYDENVIPAYFHSVCGGSTEAANNVWQTSDPYPTSVSCAYCREAPKFHWNCRISLADFQGLLVKSGLRIGQVRDVFASKLSAVSDRITEIVIEHSDGKILVRTNDLRGYLGHDLLRSTHFTVRRKDGDLCFEGKGWGHGVGLCQWGARAMAREGIGYREILQFYFPGARIAKLKE